jgi:hypothetical protein
MKNFLKYLWIAPLFFSAYQPLHASCESFDAYKRDMAEKTKPLVLIVGCGHNYTNGYDEKHSHPDSWCVNMKECSYYKHHSADQSFLETIKADAELDITDTYRCNFYYKNTFDRVVLERITSETLNRGTTLYNALTMLKVGGKLIIESYKGYDLRTYTYPACERVKNTAHDYLLNQKKTPEFNLFPYTDTISKGKIKEHLLSIWKINMGNSSHFFLENTDDFDWSELETPGNTLFNQTFHDDGLLQELKTYNTQSFVIPDEQLIPVANYLAALSCTHIINLQKGYQPYGERQDVRLLVATKTQNTEDLQKHLSQTIKEEAKKWARN